MSVAAAALDEERLPFAVRAYEPGDKHYVLDSWLKSTLSQVATKSRMSSRERHAWFTASRAAYTEVLEDPSTRVAVACDPLDRTRILGYLVGPADFHHVKAWCDPFRSLIVEALRAELES